MTCPRCGKEIQLSDDSRFCPGCGLEFQRQPVPTADQPIEQKQIDIQQIAIQKEIDNIKKNGDSNSKRLVIFAILFVLIILGIVTKVYAASVFFAIVFIYYIIESDKAINRKRELDVLASGKKIVNICPKCKSPDIEMSMVQTGGTTTHSVSRISNNINPLHPFTHTNVRKGNDYTSYSYGNQCHCRNCGYVFAKPEVLYM